MNLEKSTFTAKSILPDRKSDKNFQAEKKQKIVMLTSPYHHELAFLQKVIIVVKMWGVRMYFFLKLLTMSHGRC